MSRHITVNGQTYASVEEMPAAVRKQFEEAMRMLANETTTAMRDARDIDLTTASNSVPDHTSKISTVVTSTRFKINGKEYDRWEDIPLSARAAIKIAGMGPVHQSQAVVGEIPDNRIAAHREPPGMQVKSGRDNLSITWRSFSYETIWLSFFCLIYDVGLMYSFTAPRSAHAAPVIIQSTVFLLLLIPCILMNYSALCGFFNTTKIQLNASRLLVERGPLPCGGNRSLSAGEVEQISWARVFVPPSLSQGGVFRGCIVPGRFERNRNWLYSLNARTTTEASIQLLGLRDSDAAEFLSHTLEEKLQSLRRSRNNSSSLPV